MAIIPYAASRTKHRRSNAELDAIYSAMVRITAADHPMTLRGLFYRLVSEGLIPKAENEYEKVGRYLLKLRREGAIPYHHIADSTRWMRKPTTFDSLEDALRQTARAYRRSLWNDQAAYVEIWCEKDTLAGVLLEETAAWDVPLMVVRGFSSETYVHEAAETIRGIAKPANLYLLTDHDPSGLASARNVARKIAGFLPGFPCRVERVALRPSRSPPGACRRGRQNRPTAEAGGSRARASSWTRFRRRPCGDWSGSALSGT
jgi:hypothetical protein